MATHSSILAWRISWTEAPGGLQFMGSQRVGHDWVTNTGVFLLGFIVYGTLCASSWNWLTISFSMLGKFSTIISSKIFSYPFFLSSSSGTPIIQMLVHLIWSQRSLRWSLVLFILFTLFCSSEVIFNFQLIDLFLCFRYSAINSFWSIFNLSNYVVCLYMFIF